MLTVFSGRGRSDCDGVTRRDFVRAGALALGGLTLSGLMRAQAESGFVRDKAVVLVFLTGGASHIETFNPNMDAPAPSCSVTGEVKTPLPGVTLGGTFPLLAEHAKSMIAVRSFKHPVGDHARAVSHVLTAGTDVAGDGKQGFGMGALYARLRGANHPESGLPTYAILTSPHKDGQYSKELPRCVNGSRGGSLGPTYDPFNPAGGGQALANMKLNVPPDRLDDRRLLLKQLDALKRGLNESDAGQGFDQFQQQAVDLLTGGAGRAFDVSQENAKLVERYDTSKFHCGHKVKEPSILGRQMLVARRLVEAGSGFVTVQSAGWDMHADGNNPGVKDGMEMLGRPLDKALSAFLTDLEERGLSDKVLTIVTGDFGRTPKINAKGGRDHWASLCTLALWGGGLKTGQVIGRSDRNNGVPATDPVTPAHLLGTIMHTLFDVGTLRVVAGLPASLVKLVENAAPIPDVH